MLRNFRNFTSPAFIRRTPLARNQIVAQKRYNSHDPNLSDPNVESIAREKRQFESEVKKTLQGKGTTIPEAPGWNEKIASNSEATVKADRAPKKDFKELQKETIDRVANKEFEKNPPKESTSAADAWGKIWNKKPKSDVNL